MVDAYTQSTKLHDGFRSQDLGVERMAGLVAEIEATAERLRINWRDNIAPYLSPEELQAAGLAFAVKSTAMWDVASLKLAKALDHTATSMIGQDRASLQADIASAPATSFE